MTELARVVISRNGLRQLWKFREGKILAFQTIFRSDWVQIYIFSSIITRLMLPGHCSNSWKYSCHRTIADTILSENEGFFSFWNDYLCRKYLLFLFCISTYNAFWFAFAAEKSIYFKQFFGWNFYCVIIFAFFKSAWFHS